MYILGVTKVLQHDFESECHHLKLTDLTTPIFHIVSLSRKSKIFIFIFLNGLLSNFINN